MAHFSRRQFIRSTLSSSVSFLVGGTFGSLLGCGKTSSKICPPSGAVLADLHVHPLLDEWIETFISVRQASGGCETRSKGN